MSIDFARLNGIQSPTELQIRVEEAFRSAGEICLSEVLIQRTRAAQMILQLMAEEARLGGVNPDTGRRDTSMRRKFRIKVLCDMWGRKVKPGELVEWKADIRRRNAMKKKYTTRDMMDLRRQNREDEFVEYHAARVDADGCITVEFEDAGKLLINNGVYYKTGGPICNSKEISSRPKKGDDGIERHRHYWLYMEVPTGVDPNTLGTSKRRTILVSDAAPPAPVAAATQAPQDASQPAPKAKRGRKPKAKPEAAPEAPSAAPDVDDPSTPS